MHRSNIKNPRTATNQVIRRSLALEKNALGFGCGLAVSVNCLLLCRSEFESFLSQQFYCKMLLESEKTESPGFATFYKKLKPFSSSISVTWWRHGNHAKWRRRIKWIRFVGHWAKISSRFIWPPVRTSVNCVSTAMLSPGFKGYKNILLFFPENSHLTL